MQRSFSPSPRVLTVAEHFSIPETELDTILSNWEQQWASAPAPSPLLDTIVEKDSGISSEVAALRRIAAKNAIAPIDRAHAEALEIDSAATCWCGMFRGCSARSQFIALTHNI